MLIILAAILFHLGIPVIGILTFIRLMAKMKAENIENPPVGQMFFIFLSYIGLALAMLILTSLLWISILLLILGVFYLIFIAPLVTALIALHNVNYKVKSKYHKLIFILALAYTPTMIIYFLLASYLYSFD